MKFQFDEKPWARGDVFSVVWNLVAVAVGGLRGMDGLGHRGRLADTKAQPGGLGEDPAEITAVKVAYGRTAEALRGEVVAGPTDYTECRGDLSMKTTKHPFGYEFEALFPGQRRLIGFNDGCIHEAEREGRFFIIEWQASDDYLEPNFDPQEDAPVLVHEFETAEERQQYLDDNDISERPWLMQRVDEARSERA